MEEIQPFLNLLADPVNLTILALIGVGYIIQYTKGIENRWIPLILAVMAIFLTPAVLYYLQEYKATVAIVEGFMRGIVYTIIAWLLHNKILGKYLDPKLPDIK